MKELSLYQRVNKNADLKAWQKEVKTELNRMETENKIELEMKKTKLYGLIILFLLIIGGFADGLFR